MRLVSRLVLGVAVVLLAAGCGSVGGAVFDADPQLAPGKTSWDSVKASWQRGGAVELKGTLEDLARLAVERSPAVRAARQAWRARIGEVGPAGQPPHPTLSYTWLPLPVETRVGPNEHRVALQQRIPSVVRLAAQSSIAQARARGARLAWERAALEAAARARSLTAEIRYLQAAERLVGVHEELARQLIGAADERLQADRGTLFDVSKARSQLAQLGYDRIRFGELLQAAVARLNALLDRPPDAAVPSLAGWPLVPGPARVEPLYEAALRRDPRLLGLDAAIRVAMAGVSAAQGAFFPDIVLGVQWMINGPAANAGVADSGADAIGVSVGLSLPLWFVGDAARVDGARARVRQRVEEKRTHVSTLLADVREQHLLLVNAHRLLDLYDRTLLPEARRAVSDGEAHRRTTGAGLTDALEARQALYRYTLARERAAADALQARSRLELLTGGPLPPAGAAP